MFFEEINIMHVIDTVSVICIIALVCWAGSAFLTVAASLIAKDYKYTKEYGWKLSILILGCLPPFFLSIYSGLFCFALAVIILNYFYFAGPVLIAYHPFDDTPYWEYEKIVFVSPFKEWYKAGGATVSFTYSGKDLGIESIDSVKFTLKVSDSFLHSLYEKVLTYSKGLKKGSTVDYRKIYEKELKNAFDKALGMANKAIFKEKENTELIDLILKYIAKNFIEILNQKFKLAIPLNSDYKSIRFERAMKNLNFTHALKTA